MNEAAQRIKKVIPSWGEKDSKLPKPAYFSVGKIQLLVTYPRMS